MGNFLRYHKLTLALIIAGLIVFFAGIIVVTKFNASPIATGLIAFGVAFAGFGTAYLLLDALIGKFAEEHFNLPKPPDEMEEMIDMKAASITLRFVPTLGLLMFGAIELQILPKFFINSSLSYWFVFYILIIGLRWIAKMMLTRKLLKSQG